MYKKKNDVSVLIQCSESVIYLLISSNACLEESLGFSTHNVTSPAGGCIALCPFLCLVNFHFLAYLFKLMFQRMPNGSGWSEHPFLVLILEEIFPFPPLTMTLAVDFHKMTLTVSRCNPSVTRKGVRFCQLCIVCHSDDNAAFIPQSPTVVHHIY